jgi:hypothetical protein
MRTKPFSKRQKSPKFSLTFHGHRTEYVKNVKFLGRNILRSRTRVKMFHDSRFRDARSAVSRLLMLHDNRFRDARSAVSRLLMLHDNRFRDARSGVSRLLSEQLTAVLYCPPARLVTGRS